MISTVHAYFWTGPLIPNEPYGPTFGWEKRSRVFRFRYPEKRVSFKFGLKPVNRNFTFKPEKNSFSPKFFSLFDTEANFSLFSLPS